jgi:hypothetical protein
VPNHYHFDGVLYHTLDLIYLCEFDARPSVTPADDLADVVWLGANEIDEAQLAFESTRRALRLFRR